VRRRPRQATAAGVGLDGEQDVLAADVVLLVGAGAGVPVVPGELVVGAVEESLALVAVLADEQHVGWAFALAVHHRPHVKARIKHGRRH
jgi:hypothetical protein